MAHIRPATLLDALRLIFALRDEDRQEGKAAGECVPVSIFRSYWRGNAFALFNDGNFVGLMGCHGIKDRFGIPWMLGTKHTPKAKRILPIVKAKLAEWIDEYTYLRNEVWTGNPVHIRFIDQLGFEFVRVVEKNGHKFIVFEIYK